ncbi:alpha/beta fold hydrolase [Salipiger sp. H15]|uniref:Alpha/beta fold hydrolase n=1 Tax=Alloyangia sp. H15 TaxID=3029062 RepID=A0AAU8ADE1_9RHOB
MGMVMANGLDLSYDAFGAAEDPALLLVSGLGTQRIRWGDGFCAALAGRGYHVIRYDNRDAGLSTHLHGAPVPDLGAVIAALRAGRAPEIPYGLGDMAADAVALLDALAIPRAHVVGRSMGGMIAQVLACEHPGRVRSLTSVMSGTGNPDLPQAAPDVMALMSAPRPDPALDPEGYVAASLAFARRIAGTGAPFDAAHHRWLVLEEARRGHDPAGAARQLAAMVATGDRRARLAGITVPTLVIHGTDDPLIPPACGADTAAAIPGAGLMLVEGMGHDLPAALDERIVSAIDRTARRAA